MSVRMLAVLGVSLAATVGGAQASSIIVLGVSASTPSVIELGAASSTPSIVALGDPQPDVTDEKVAAIPDHPERKHGFAQNPLIIRGGIVGGAFPSPAAAPTKANAAAAPAPATGAKPAADSKPAATASNSKPQPKPAASQPTHIPPVGKAM